MSSWSMSRRIFTGFGALLVVLVLVGALGLLEVMRLGGIYTEYRLTSRQTNAMSEINEGLMDTQIVALAYFLDPGAENARKVSTAVAETIADERKSADLFAGNAGESAQLSDILAGLEQY